MSWRYSPFIVSTWRPGVSGSSRSTTCDAATSLSMASVSGSTTASMNSWSLLSKWR
jgi:methyl coenzyme M reductase alpha subunit